MHLCDVSIKIRKLDDGTEGWVTTEKYEKIGMAKSRHCDIY